MALVSHIWVGKIVDSGSTTLDFPVGGEIDIENLYVVSKTEIVQQNHLPKDRSEWSIGKVVTKSITR